MQLVPRPSWNSRASSPGDASIEAFDRVASRRLPNMMPDTVAQADRVIIFIDGSNLFYAAMQMGLEIDYARLLNRLTEGRQLVRAYFYTGVDRHNEKQQGFLLWMRRNGYRVVTKDLMQYADGSKRANLDVEIAVDMMMLSDCCDTAVLLSGDGDLAYVVNHVAYRGVRVEVVSLPAMTSDSLINIADRFIDLSSLRGDIQRIDPPSPAPSSAPSSTPSSVH